MKETLICLGTLEKSICYIKLLALVPPYQDECGFQRLDSYLSHNR